MKLIKRSVLLLWLLIRLIQPLLSQNYIFPTEVIKYFPAPGQHINDPKTGIPEKANELTQKISSGVSLGAYGGYIIFYFENGIENHPDNPYGIDFTVFGNSFTGSGEPGIVMIMKDDNLNGLPDENWYEIAGSLHHTDLLIPDYEVQYFQTLNHMPGDVCWTNNNNINGGIVYNQFHEQAYYPDKQYFIEYPEDSVSFSGNRLAVSVVSEQGILKTGNYLFGYADNIQQNQGVSLNLPDNPYTPEIIEGAGGNAIDISWAMDQDGFYSATDKIHFIKIYSAVQANAGPLGEVSTDVTGVIDVPPNHSITGPSEVISMETLPDRIISGSTWPLEAILFKQGKPAQESLHWESDKHLIAGVIGDSILQAKKSGEITLSVFSSDKQILNRKKIIVVSPDHVLIESDFDRMLQNKVYQINAYIIDNEGYRIDRISPEVLDYDSTLMDIEKSGNGVFKLKGLKPGNTVISFGLSSNSSIKYDFNIEVVSVPDPVQVSFGMQLEDEALIERSWFTIEKQNSREFIERGEDQSDLYSDPDINLTDVITQVLLTSGFSGEGNSFHYRMDEHSNGKLYLWQLGVNWEYHYGWGGSIENFYQSSWVVSINDSIYYNDFNKIVIRHGDIINLSLVKNVTGDWENLILLPEKQAVEPGEEINFYLQRYIYQPINNQIDITKDNASIEQNELLINGIPSGNLAQLLSDDGHSFLLDFDQEGIYQITLEGYEEFSVHVYAGLTGLSMFNQNQQDVIIYPNPCSEKIFIKTDRAMPGRVRILNLQSAVLIDKKMIGSDEEINLSHLKPGMYLIEIENEEYSNRKMFIKE